MKSLSALALVLILAASCGRDDARGSSPAETETPVPIASATPEPPPPFSLSRPLEPAEALSEDFDTNTWFIVDVESGLVQVLRDDWEDPCPTSAYPDACIAHGGVIGVHWAAAETLLVVPFYGQGYLLELDGRARIAEQAPSEISSSPTGGGVSADGRWQASVTAVDGSGVVVGTAGTADRVGEVLYKITKATLPRWSPADPDLLALITDDCARFHLSLFEPDSGVLWSISESPHELITDFIWRPDGSAIAAGMVSAGESQTEPRSEIGLIDVDEAFLSASTPFPMRTIAAMSRPGLLVPERWSADGSKLLVRFFEERDMCRDGAGVTEVEVLGP